MKVGDAHVFPGFLTPLLTHLPFPKQLTTFLTCLSRGERRKNAGKKVRLNRVSNSQPPSHKSDTSTTEPSAQCKLMTSKIMAMMTLKMTIIMLLFVHVLVQNIMALMIMIMLPTMMMMMTINISIMTSAMMLLMINLILMLLLLMIVMELIFMLLLLMIVMELILMLLLLMIKLNLTISSIFTHFNTLKKKAVVKHFEQFHLSQHCFPCNMYFEIL